MVLSSLPCIMNTGRGLMRATSSTGATWSALIPSRRSMMNTVTGAKGKAGRFMKCSKLLATALLTLWKEDSETTALISGVSAAAMMAAAPPIDSPSAPTFSPSASPRSFKYLTAPWTSPCSRKPKVTASPSLSPLLRRSKSSTE